MNMSNQHTIKLTKAPAFRWYALFLFIISFGHFYIAFQSIISLSTSVTAELQLSLVQLSFLTTATMVALLIFPFIGAQIASRYGAKNSVLFALALQIAASALFPLIGKSYAALLVLRFLQGAAGGIVANTAMAYTPLWFPVKERGLASGILMGVIGLGMSISSFFAPKLIAFNMSWQMAVASMVIVPGIIIFLLVLFTGKDIYTLYGVETVEEALEKPKDSNVGVTETDSNSNIPATLKEAQRGKVFWMFCITSFAIVWSLYGFGVFLPNLLMHDMGISAAATTNIISMTFFVSFVASPLGGIVSDKVFKGKRWQTVLLGGLMVAVCLAIIPKASNITLLTILLIAAYAGVNIAIGPFWALPSVIVKTSAVLDVVGFATMVANIGGITAAPIMAATISATGSSFMSLYITMGLSVMWAICMLIIRK